MNEMTVTTPFGEANTEITEATAGGSFDFSGLENASQRIFCSIPINTPEDRKKLFKIAQSNDNKVDDMCNKTIELVDVYAEVATLKDGTKAPRIILIDKDDNYYSCTSFGILHALEKLFYIYGAPHYETPVAVIPKRVKTSQGHTLTLTM